MPAPFPSLLRAVVPSRVSLFCSKKSLPTAKSCPVQRCTDVWMQLREFLPAAWRPWQAHLANLLDAQGHAIDQVVVTFFECPRSYTAEDLVEIASHRSEEHTSELQSLRHL